jgi:hypothetical protein
MDAAYYRKQAKLCRDIATSILDRKTHEALLEIATDYEQRAVILEQQAQAAQADETLKK